MTLIHSSPEVETIQKPTPPMNEQTKCDILVQWNTICLIKRNNIDGSQKYCLVQAATHTHTHTHTHTQ